MPTLQGFAEPHLDFQDSAFSLTGAPQFSSVPHDCNGLAANPHFLECALQRTDERRRRNVGTSIALVNFDDLDSASSISDRDNA